MGKKAALIVISVFLRNHPRYQIIAASLMVQISFFLHVFLKPYDVITSYGIICNKLETISLLSLVMTLSTGLFFGTVDSGYQLGTFEDVLIITLLLSNGGIALYFVFYFLILTVKTVKTHAKIFVKKYIRKDSLPCCLKMCSERCTDALIDWGEGEDPDNYGIPLTTSAEKDIFSNFFREKQNKIEKLNTRIDGLKDKKVSVKLDRLRSQIQVMEKERCWQTVTNNRLYNEVKKVVMISKVHLDDETIKELDEVFQIYIDHGIKYNLKMNNLYMKELEDLLKDDEDEKNKSEVPEGSNIILSINPMHISDDDSSSEKEGDQNIVI